MNIGTESTNSPERIDIPGSFAETSSIPSATSQLEALVAPITDSFKTPEKISSEVGCISTLLRCTPEPEPGCSQILSAVEPDIYTTSFPPMTICKQKLHKSEILTSTPIKEEPKQKFAKNKVF
ncbi:unnamed protein product [Pieris macdunnoughi]|uniref:Uncharacterized protein n=1 Tax=Pieris macdunnoughi TaxID=345717 RepID=A0A821XEG7_9NEOP|nr:unnamed protein product [Pieris macdunnoughi]